MKIKPTFEALPDDSTFSRRKDFEKGTKLCVFLHTLTLCSNKENMSPDFLNIALQCVPLKLSQLAARVPVTEMKHWHRNLSCGGDGARSSAATSSDWQPPGVRDTKAKSKPKGSA